MEAGRIDVHHHFLPDVYVKAVHKAGGDPAGWTLPNWTLAMDMEFNKKHQIGTTILTLSAPGADISPGKGAVTLAAKTNDLLAQIRDNDPTHYGFFAELPPPLDTAACINEIDRSLDELNADGVILFTRYGNDNHYLGHPDFAPVWDHLNAKHAVVFIHPTHLVSPSLVNSKLPQPMIDYPHETTRTAVDMIMAGILRRCPNCKIILSHAGGSLPFMASRPAAMLPYVPGGQAQAGYVELTMQEFITDAKKFYFDVALSGDPLTLACLKGFARADRILFGSDFPYAPLEAIDYMTDEVDKFVSGEEREAWMRGNALKLFPRLNGNV